MTSNRCYDIYNLKLNTSNLCIKINVKIYKINNEEIGIVAKSKKINFSYSFSVREIDIKSINKEIKKKFKSILKERNIVSNKIVVFEMPDGELFISF